MYRNVLSVLFIQLLGVRHCLYQIWIDASYYRCIAEQLVIVLLSVDELELVEFHVIFLLLDKAVLLDDLLVLVLDHLKIFRP